MRILVLVICLVLLLALIASYQYTVAPKYISTLSMTAPDTTITISLSDQPSASSSLTIYGTVPE